MYFGRTVPFLVAESTAVVVGAAYGALDIYDDIVKAKKAPFPPFPYRYELAEIQHNYGRCQTLIDTAYFAAMRMPASNTWSWRRARRRAGRHSTPTGSGGCTWSSSNASISVTRRSTSWCAPPARRACARTAMLGRYWRNIATIRTHLAHQSDSTAINYGRFHFGLPVIGRM